MSECFQISSPRKLLVSLQLLHLQRYGTIRKRKEKRLNCMTTRKFNCRHINEKVSNLRCYSNINNFRVLDQNSFKVSRSYLIFRMVICYSQFVTNKTINSVFSRTAKAIPEILCT
jgi:hypothetical protein